MMRKVRKLRHWKQRFDKNAKFIWRHNITWAGENVVPGDPIPKSLEDNPTKLRRFWQSNVIELAEFEEPDVATGQKPERKAAATSEPVKDDRKPEDLITKQTDRKWLVEGDETVYPSKTKALEAAEAVLAKAPATEDDVMLLGSSEQVSEVDVHGETVTLGEIVQLAFEDSGLTKAEWNDLDDQDREGRLQDVIEMMLDLGEDEDDWLGEDPAEE